MTPHSDSPSSPGHPGMKAGGKPLPNRFRILIVDDQPANRVILSRLLNITGYLTFEACDGLAALHSIESQGADLVIMDVEMPNMNGVEAIRKIRNLSDPRLASLPILAATGNPQPECQRELLDAGANAFLTKPFDTGALLRTISILLSPSPDFITECSNERNTKSGTIKKVS